MFFLDTKIGMLGPNLGDEIYDLSRLAGRVSHFVARSRGVAITPDGRRFQCGDGFDNGGEFTNPMGSTCRPRVNGPSQVTEEIGAAVTRPTERLPLAVPEATLLRSEPVDTLSPAARVIAFDASDDEMTRLALRDTEYTGKIIDLNAPPDEVAADWLRGLGEDETSGEEDLVLALLDKNGEEVGRLQFSPYDGEYSPDEKTLYIDLLSLERSEQGKGTGSTILKNLIELAQTEGYTNIRLTANIDVGGHAWGRLGFVPEKAGGYTRSALRALDRYRKPDGTISKTVEFEDGPQTFVMTPANAALAESLLNRMVKSDGSIDRELFRQFMDIDGVEAVTLNSFWDAVLHFDDPDSMAMARKKPRQTAVSAAQEATLTPSLVDADVVARVAKFEGTDEEFTQLVLRGTDYTAKVFEVDWSSEPGGLDNDTSDAKKDTYISLLNKDGEDVGQLKYMLTEGDSPDEKILYLDMLTLEQSSDQGKGTGSQILKNLIELSQADGLSGISLLANIDVGGYAWGRLGFVPDGGIGFTDVILRRFDRFSDIGGTVSRFVGEGDDRREVRMNAANVALARSLLQRMDRPDDTIDPKLFREFMAIEGIETIMLGAQWNGSLRFDDPDAMRMAQRNRGRA